MEKNVETKRPAPPTVQPQRTLTVEQYQAMRPQDIAHDFLYNKGGWFCAAVNKLIADGKI